MPISYQFIALALAVSLNSLNHSTAMITCCCSVVVVVVVAVVVVAVLQ